MVRNMEMDFIDGLMEVLIKEDGYKIKFQDKVIK
jgi:hypothetical protein